MMNSERDLPLAQQRTSAALGWFARGFVEGAVTATGDKSFLKAVDDFDLSIPVVVAHLSAYCLAHETKTTADAVEELLLKVLKGAK